MPLRDPFHSPINDKHRWDAVHGQWPEEIVRTLYDILPEGFIAEPQVYHGAPFEVDVSMTKDDDLLSPTQLSGSLQIIEDTLTGVMMPLRDHFHSPINDKHRWDAVHGGWPMELVRTLHDILPEGFIAEPQVYHRAPFEVDVSMTEDDDRPSATTRQGGTATLTISPTLTVPADLSTLDEYEVRVYDVDRERTLVAAIEIISPANKDRPESRDQFTNKIASLLRHDVCVAVVDIVTSRHANLYDQLLTRIGRIDPSLGEAPPILYSVTLRTRKPRKKPPLLDAWFFPLSIGQPLPTIPLWLSPDLAIELPLEPSYQEVCRLLRIP